MILRHFSPPVQLRAGLELSLAGALWGFGFIAVVWALTEIGPLTITGARFLLASLAGGGIALAFSSLRASLNRKQFFLAAIPGLLLSLTLVLQTWGLKTTTATKSGFLTTLYVLFVPLLERIWLKRKVPRFHLVYVTLALLGVALICDLPGLFRGAPSAPVSAADGWTCGDFLTLACALVAALHIVWFALIHERIESAFVFNLFQSIWAGAIPLALALFWEGRPRWPLGQLPLLGLGMLAFGSTLIAFALQIRAQKTISPTTASLLFLLESPFATLFAIYFLNESLRESQWIGAGLILLAAFLSTVFSREVLEPDSGALIQEKRNR